MKIKEFFVNKKIFFLYLFLIFSFSLFLMSFLVRETDYFWHIKAGEYMVKNSRFLTRDIFSWIVKGKYWMSHEWLFEIIIYLLKLVSNNYHIFIYAFLFLFSMMIILFLTNRKEYLKNIPFSLFWLSLSMIFIGVIQCRPHLISYNLLAITIWVLYDLYQDENSKKYLILPVVTIIWSNVHGGSSNLPYLLSLVFLIGGIFGFSFKKISARRYSKKQFFKYFLIMIVCVLCISVNPHGIKMLFYPYQNMLDGFMLKTIAEWQPTNLNDFSHYTYFVLIIIIVCVFLFSSKKIKLIDLLLFCFVLFLGLKSIRFWPYTYIVMSYIIFYYIPSRKNDNGTEFVLFILSILLIIIFAINNKMIIKNINKKVLNDEVVSYIKTKNAKRLYNYYDYGGYLIYCNISVFIDGRADLYSNYNYKDYYKISSLAYGYEKIIKKYDFDYFIIPKDIGLATYLDNNDSYSLVFSDKKVVIYEMKK